MKHMAASSGRSLAPGVWSRELKATACVCGLLVLAGCAPLLKVPANTIVPTDDTAGSSGFIGGPNGRFQVSRDGEAQYTYPLWVPPGRQDMQPNLALQYGSRNADGVLGVGWQLTGLPRIERCPRTRAIDGRNKPVQFDDSDAYCLSGERLVVVTGRNGAANAEYRTRNDQFVRIVSGPSDGAGLGPQYFRAYLKSGKILSFGLRASTSQSRLETARVSLNAVDFFNPVPVFDNRQTVRLSWSLDQVEDRFGNQVLIDYAISTDSLDGVEQLPSSIRYTDTADGSLPAQRRVTFRYENRDDVHAWNVSGFRTYLDQRLSRIELAAPDPDSPRTVRIYRFSYALYPPTERKDAPSALVGITECDARATTVSPDGVCGETLRVQWTAAWRHNEYFDIDTGIHDSTSSLSGASSEGALFASLVSGDFDGDGCDDLMFATMDPPQGPQPWPLEWHVRLSSCYEGAQNAPLAILSTRTPTSLPVPLPSTAQIRSVDVDLDGRTDVIAVGQGASLSGVGVTLNTWPVSIYLAGTDPSRLFTKEIDSQVAAPGVGQNGGAVGVTGNFITPVPYIGDVTGDGFPDVITGVPTPDDNQGFSTFLWFGQNTHGTIPASAGCPAPCLAESAPIQAVDGPPHQGVQGIGSENTYLVDIDGDGADELLLRVQAPGMGGWSNYLPSYYAFSVDAGGNQHVAPLALIPGELMSFPPAGGPAISGAIDYFVDVNGDGLPDVVRWPYSGGPLRGPVRNLGSGFSPAGGALIEPTIDATTSFNSSAFEPDPGVRVVDFDQSGVEDLLLVNCRTTGKPSPVVLMQLQRNGFVSVGSQKPILVTPTDSYGNPLPCADEADDGTVLSQTLDINGDGAADLAQVVKGDLHVYLRMPVSTLAEVIEDNGVETRLTYAPIADTAVYTVDHPGAQMQQCGPPTCPGTVATLQRYGVNKGLTVVKTYQVTHPGYYATPPTYSLTYHNGLFDRSAGGWVGFESVTEVDLQNQSSVQTDYDLSHTFQTGSDPSIAGTVYPAAMHALRRTEKYPLPDGSEVDRIRTITPLPLVDAQSSDPSERTQVYSALPSEVLEQEFEQPAGATTRSLVRQFDTTYNYTQFGDVHIATTQTGDGDTEKTIIDRLDDQTDWLISLPTSVTHISTTPAGTDASYVTYTPLAGKGVVQHANVEPAKPPAEEQDQYLGVTYGYDPHGQPTSINMVDYAGTNTRTLTLTWDSLEDEFLSRLTNGAGQSYDFAMYPAFGVTAASADPNGILNRWQYDGFGRLKATAPAAGGQQAFSYETRTVVITEPTGSRTQLNADAYGNVIERLQTGFNGQYWDTTFDYDEAGHLASVNGPCVFTGAPCAYNDTRTFDSMGRLTRVDHADGSSVHWKYSGLTTTVTDESGHASSTTTDQSGRVTLVERTADDGHPVRASVAVGPFGEVASVSDALGTVSFGYDSRGRRTSIEDPDSGQTTVQYNAYNQPRYALNQKGESVQWSYDGLGRPWTVVSKDGATIFNWDTAVDSNGKLNAIGKLGSTVSPDQVVTLESYDSAGRSNGRTWIRGGDTLSTSVEYDAFGRVRTVTYPQPWTGSDAVKVQYCYESDGFLQMVVEPNLNPNCDAALPQLLSVTSMSAQEDVDKALDGNGVLTSWSIDPQRDFFKDLTVTLPNGAGAAMDLHYQHYANGDVSERTDSVAGVSEGFTYDSLDRLKTWNISSGMPALLDSTETYTVDDGGNLRSREVSLTAASGSAGTNTSILSYGQNAGPHALTSVDGQTIAYDPIGQRDSAPNESETYTAFGLPKEIQKSGADIFYLYDAAQTRFARLSGSESTLYAGGLYEQRDSGNGTKTDIFYVKVGDQIIAQLDRDRASGQITRNYLHSDFDGSLWAVTDQTGTLQAGEKRRYDPYGAARDPVQPWVAAQPSSSPIRRGFLSQEVESEVQLLNLNARIYDPRTAHFLTPDPIAGSPEAEDSLNPYAYGLNNPLRWRDSSGLCAAAGPNETVVCAQRDTGSSGGYLGDFIGIPVLRTPPGRSPRGGRFTSSHASPGPLAHADASGKRDAATGTDEPMAQSTSDANVPQSDTPDAAGGTHLPQANTLSPMELEGLAETKKKIDDYGVEYYFPDTTEGWKDYYRAYKAVQKAAREIPDFQSTLQTKMSYRDQITVHLRQWYLSMKSSNGLTSPPVNTANGHRAFAISVMPSERIGSTYVNAPWHQYSPIRQTVPANLETTLIHEFGHVRGYLRTLLPDAGIGPADAGEVNSDAIWLMREAYRIYDMQLSPEQEEALDGGIHP